MLGASANRSIRGLGLLAIAATLVVIAACQYVAGVQSRSADPIGSGCSLPSNASLPQVRIANLATTADVLDLCIRPAGESWGEPVILNGGAGCGQYFPSNAQGFTYGQVSVPFAAPAQKVDVKFVAGGSACSAAGLSEADGVELEAKPASAPTQVVTTLIQTGGHGVPLKIVALPEWDAPVSGSGGLIRVVHALPGLGPIDVGGTTSPTHQLPATLTVPFTIAPIPYGHTSTKGTRGPEGSVQENGYIPVFNGTTDVGGALHGQSDALFLFPQLEIGNEEETFYAIGIENDDAYPLRALDCVESGQQATTTNNPFVVACTASPLSTLSFDVFNPALYGPGSPLWVQRDTLMTGPDSPIAQRNSDVMCLVEVDQLADQQAIQAAAATAGFKYTYSITTDLSTPFSNGGRTQDGGTCMPPSQPACTGVPQSLLDQTFQCMEQKCSDIDGGAGRLVTTTSCLEQFCKSEIGQLLLSFPACSDCVLDYVASSEPYSHVESLCTTGTQAPMGFDGANSSMILSKYPLMNSDKYILSSSMYRRSVLYSQVQFEGNLTVDFYCGFFISPLISNNFPYLGCFGNGMSNLTQAAYAAENYFQAHEMAAWVESKSGNRPAVIVGDWRAGLGTNMPVPTDAGAPQPTPLIPATIQLLASYDSKWAAPSGANWPHGGQCSACPGSYNPVNGMDTSSYFTLQPFLYNWPQASNAMVDEQLIYTGDVLALPEGGTGPVTPYYGVNFHVIRPSGKSP
jgi:hypothetical protein